MKTNNEINRYCDLTDESIKRLDSISSWTRFLGIYLYVLTALLVILGFYGFLLTDGRGFGGLFLIGVCTAIGIVYYYIGKHLKNGGESISVAINEDSPEIMEQGFKNLKCSFKVFGWMTIVLIVVSMLAIVFSAVIVPIILMSFM